MNQTAKDHLYEALAELGQPVFKKLPFIDDTVTSIAITTLRAAMIDICKALVADAEPPKVAEVSRDKIGPGGYPAEDADDQ